MCVVFKNFFYYNKISSLKRYISVDFIRIKLKKYVHYEENVYNKYFHHFIFILLLKKEEEITDIRCLVTIINYFAKYTWVYVLSLL